MSIEKSKASVESLEDEKTKVERLVEIWRARIGSNEGKNLAEKRTGQISGVSCQAFRLSIPDQILC